MKPPFPENRLCTRCGHEYRDSGVSKPYDVPDLCQACDHDDKMLTKIARDWTVSS